MAAHRPGDAPQVFLSWRGALVGKASGQRSIGKRRPISPAARRADRSVGPHAPT